MDADAILLRAIDDVFAAARPDHVVAAPDCCPPAMFNAGKAKPGYSFPVASERREELRPWLTSKEYVWLVVSAYPPALPDSEAPE